MEPELITGGVAVDDRGSLSFVNSFDFRTYGIRRMYTVQFNVAEQVRAWHGHKIEHKYMMCIDGAALVCAARVLDWLEPVVEEMPSRYVLAMEKVAVLCIPAGYIHGIMSLRPMTRLLVFSTASLEEGKNDDFRFPPRFIDPWFVIER